jgi:RNAse (barnase) inhibitor barstar
LDLDQRGSAFYAPTVADTHVYEVNGNAFSTLEEFFDEISRVSIPGAYWDRNLDAFNDILRGGFGTPDGGFTLRWLDHDESRRRLGYAETVRQLEIRLTRCHPSNREHVRTELAAAKAGTGQTVFDWLIEIIQVHGPGGREADDRVLLELA